MDPGAGVRAAAAEEASSTASRTRGEEAAKVKLDDGMRQVPLQMRRKIADGRVWRAVEREDVISCGG